MAPDTEHNDFARGPLLLIIMLVIIILSIVAFLVLRPRGPDARLAPPPATTVRS